MTKAPPKELQGREKLSFAKMRVSLLIISVILIQLYSAVLVGACKAIKIPLCFLPEEPALYPFLDYPMYARVRPEGATVNNYELIAIFSDGTEKQLQAEDFGLAHYWFVSIVLPVFKSQNMSKIKKHVEAYSRLGNQPFVAFRIDDAPVTVHTDGTTAGKKMTGDRISITAGAQ